MVEFGSPALMASIVKDRMILVLKFSNHYNHQDVNQKYVLPGGRPKEGETLSNALIREVKEETNLDVNVMEVIRLDLLINKPNGKLRPIAFYNCNIVEDKEIKLSEEHEDYKWISLDEAKSLEWIDNCFFRFLEDLE